MIHTKFHRISPVCPRLSIALQFSPTIMAEKAPFILFVSGQELRGGPINALALLPNKTPKTDLDAKKQKQVSFIHCSSHFGGIFCVCQSYVPMTTSGNVIVAYCQFRRKMVYLCPQMAGS